MLAGHERALDGRRERGLLAARLVHGITCARERPFERSSGSEHVFHRGEILRGRTDVPLGSGFGARAGLGTKVRNLRDCGERCA